MGFFFLWLSQFQSLTYYKHLVIPTAPHHSTLYEYGGASVASQGRVQVGRMPFDPTGCCKDCLIIINITRTKLSKGERDQHGPSGPCLLCINQLQQVCTQSQQSTARFRPELGHQNQTSERKHSGGDEIYKDMGKKGKTWILYTRKHPHTKRTAILLGKRWNSLCPLMPFMD